MRTLTLIALLLVTPVSAATDDVTVYYVLNYTPGENWAPDTSYEAQPGIQAHLEYLNELFEERRLLMGGRLRDRPAGLMILRTGSLEEAREVAANDPGVVEGIVEATVDIWDVRLSGMRWTKHRPLPITQDPDEPWRLKRIDPSSPINLEQRD